AYRALLLTSWYRRQVPGPPHKDRALREAGWGSKLSYFKNLHLHSLRGALWRMRHGRYVVFDVGLLETEAFETLGRQGDVVIARTSMAYQQTLFLFQVFQRPDDVGIRIGAGAIKQFLCQDACVLLFPYEA